MQENLLFLLSLKIGGLCKTSKQIQWSAKQMNQAAQKGLDLAPDEMKEILLFLLSLTL